MSKTLYVYVGNLDASVTADDLDNLFAQYGTVTSAWIVTDEMRAPGRSLGFGFVEMADGAEAAIEALHESEFKGCTLCVNEVPENEARPESAQPDQDRFAEICDRHAAHYDRPDSSEFRKVVHDLQEMAETAHAEAAHTLADVLAVPGPYYDPEAAYKWYYFALSEQGYSVEFNDENHDPPHYCGPAGDFRNESMVSDLVETLGFEKVRSLDAEAKRWLAERNL